LKPFWLVRPYREAGLAVANTLSAGFNTALLLFALRKKLTRLDMTGLPRNVFTLLGAAAAAGAVAFGVYRFWDVKFGHTHLAVNFGAAYWLLSLWAKVPATKKMSGLIRQKLPRRVKDSK
jgi:peptidoglycan biosynthesis protein MviN/MurJ (putative lipid II flippase)